MLQSILNINGEAKHFKPRKANHKLKGKKSKKALNLILLAPFLGLLWPQLYAKTEPTLFGFPFFYWYQFAWVIASALVTGIVYFATQRRERHGKLD